MQSDDNKKFDALVVGDASQAFWDASEIEGFSVRQCDTAVDAITITDKQTFKTIYVVMSSFNGNLESAVDTLGKIGKNSRLVLLAQMYEEPLARQMLRTINRPANTADDYQICPLDAKNLFDGIALVEESPAKTKQPQPEITDVVPAATAVSKSRQAQDTRIRELEKLATEDDLTGLKNRRYLREFLRQILLRADSEGFNATLLIFDIDDFKHYNDSYGHAVGNNVLVQTAMMMKRCWRDNDVVGRIGGDEFAVVFWDRPIRSDEIEQDNDADIPIHERRSKQNSEHPQEAMFIAERFRQEMNATDLCLLGTDGKGVLTISGGLASFPRDGSTVEELFEKADQAMLDAKRRGKNRIYLVGTPNHG